MNANSKLLEVFEKKSREVVESTEPPKDSIQLNEIYRNFTIPKEKSFVEDIKHETPDVDFEVDYFQLVLMTRDRVVLVENEGRYTFPILAKEMPSQTQIAEYTSTYNIQHPRTIVEPSLRSAFLVGETDKEGILKSDIIQYHSANGIEIHPSVWSFFYNYPEYIGDDLLYKTVTVQKNHDYIVEYLEDNYDAFVMKNDDKRFSIKGQEIERRLGNVGYIDVETTENLDEIIDSFIKEYNTVDHICIRIPQDNKILPLWITNPQNTI